MSLTMQCMSLVTALLTLWPGVSGQTITLSISLTAILTLWPGVSGQGDLCQTQTGQSNIVLDLMESLGNDYSQLTVPGELPITGEPGTDMTLDLVFSQEEEIFFRLEGKSLRLIKPLDRDQKDKSSLVFQVKCTVMDTGKRRTIPVIVRLSDLNDNSPKFLGTPYSITIPESTPINSTVFTGLRAHDLDAGANGLVKYEVVEGDGSSNDGYKFFAINLPHQGIITVTGTLDYEVTSTYYVRVVASDRSINPDNRFTATTTLTVHVQDSDDLDPTFLHPGYSATVVSGVNGGVLDIFPEKIMAEDQDTIRNEINYYFVEGSPNFYSDYFAIDARTGVVRQTRVLDRTTASSFSIMVQAVEMSSSKRRTRTSLNIIVEAKDNFPPVLTVSSQAGFVEENSAIGTVVRDKDGREIVFRVTDNDRVAGDSGPMYIYEMTSAQFDINADNQLVVADGNLDRDPPSEDDLIVQVVVREDIKGGKASSPVAIKIHLSDVNDNAPTFNSVAPITIQAGSTRRLIANLNATDIDENDKIRYRIIHVSNSGKRKFYMNPVLGRLEVVAKVLAGETYSVTVEAMDNSQKTSQAIVEVYVSQGPNIRPPKFFKSVYDVQVSEGSPRHTTVVTVTATDPEESTVTYSIVSGNNLEHFTIGESTGVIRVMQSLDREDLKRYTLSIEAKDEGGKVDQATVNIKVTDVNDQNPQFMEEPYSFRVKEGLVTAYVGKVKAEDRDIGENAKISYSVPEESPFTIDTLSGKISTKMALDFEHQQVHYVVVTAKDGADVPRLATATATVLVQDMSDELPSFPKTEYTAVVPENIPDFVVVSVEAVDKDTLSQVTYRIMQGELDKFKIDPETGEIRTIYGLDYEQASKHVLVIGTEQGRLEGSRDPGASCTVTVEVADVNDMAPQFIRMPQGRQVQVRNDAQVGDKIGAVLAEDGDGTAPGNKVRYELVGKDSSERSERYFRLDPDTGDIIVTDDLTKELFDEYKLVVRAYDDGEPSLDTVVTILAKVSQVVTMPPNTGVGFADLQHVIEVMENTPQEAVLKRLTLIKKPERNIRIRCDVVQARDRDGRDVRQLFKGSLDENKDCNLVLARSVLDHETMDKYRVIVELNTLTAFVNPNRMIANINVTVLDKNDNRPEFMYTAPYNKLVPKQYLATVSESTPIQETVYTVAASDRDSGDLGKIVYEIATETEDFARQHFTIDRNKGIVKTVKPFQNIPEEALPFRLIITARDNPDRVEDSKMEKTTLVVNLVREGYLMVLSIRDTPHEVMENKRDQLANLLQDQTELVVEVDQIIAARSPVNGSCCESDPTGSDVWFYAVDPETLKILHYNSSRVATKITDKPAQTSLKYIITGDLHVQAREIRAPLASIPRSTSPPTASVKVLPTAWKGYPAALIAFGCLIFALSLAAIIYLLVLYTKYKYHKDRSQRMVVIPRYEPVFVEPHLKEYETQVLQMSVAVDEIDNDMKIDFSRNRTHVFDPGFNLDSVSYITHEHSSSASPTSDTATHTTFRSGSISGRPSLQEHISGRPSLQEHISGRPSLQEHMTGRPSLQEHMSGRPSLQDHITGRPSLQDQQPIHLPIERALSRRDLLPNHYNHLDLDPVDNPLYEKSSDSEDGLDVRMPQASITNENVVFREKKDFATSTPKRTNSFGVSPIDATTQL